MQQRSAEWFKVRCGRITGSRFAQAMAGRNTQVFRQLVDELVSERLSRQVSRGYVSPAMQWGIDHESAARNWYERFHGRTVMEIGFVVHPQFDFVGVSPDGLIDHDGLVEIKCPQLPNFMRVNQSQEVPSRYRWQVQGQLWVCQREWLDFVCFYPPGRGVVIRVESSLADCNQLAERCLEINDEVERSLRLRASMGTAATKRHVSATASHLSDSQHRRRNAPLDSRASAKSKFSWLFWVVIVVIVLVLMNR